MIAIPSLQKPEQPNLGFVPQLMVYEEVPVEPARWEYAVLTIDTNQRSLPDTERLNELGREGWLLNGVVQQAIAGDTSLVHYYFIRQVHKNAVDKEKGAQK